jgi:hypothetical protein
MRFSIKSSWLSDGSRNSRKVSARHRSHGWSTPTLQMREQRGLRQRRSEQELCRFHVSVGRDAHRFHRGRTAAHVDEVAARHGGQAAGNPISFKRQQEIALLVREEFNDRGIFYPCATVHFGDGLTSKIQVNLARPQDTNFSLSLLAF